ncbi:uncharacterized protein C17orf62 homolog [Sinocyclocheilus grahami]|uniref:uncharacterized protein C17orf62 homolog n=1 Tax=Sinocyclocheilus grahami TaxID=75366 RepID=UPI0007AD29CF|nr:PREDICTED: uncharacterized protein C17orf62 homolog [Sinocyclocheilus grahami]
MGYMVVEKHTSDLLHLKRSPGIRSWSLLVGIASVGLAAAYYSADSILWKMFYVTGCFFVALQNMEEWEEAVFDKSKSEIELKTFSVDVEALAALLKRFLGLEELQRRLAEEELPDDDDIEDLGLGDSSDSKDEDEL